MSTLWFFVGFGVGITATAALLFAYTIHVWLE